MLQTIVWRIQHELGEREYVPELADAPRLLIRLRAAAALAVVYWQSVWQRKLEKRVKRGQRPQEQFIGRRQQIFAKPQTQTAQLSVVRGRGETRKFFAYVREKMAV